MSTWESQFKKAFKSIAPVYTCIARDFSPGQMASVSILAEQYWRNRQTKTVECAIERALRELDPHHKWVAIPPEAVAALKEDGML
jgi:hypothetical protein